MMMMDDSDEFGAELRRLALTVATFERSLFAYALRIRRARKKAAAARRSSPQLMTNNGHHNHHHHGGHGHNGNDGGNGSVISLPPTAFPPTVGAPAAVSLSTLPSPLASPSPHATTMTNHGAGGQHGNARFASGSSPQHATNSHHASSGHHTHSNNAAGYSVNIGPFSPFSTPPSSPPLTSTTDRVNLWKKTHPSPDDGIAHGIGAIPPTISMPSSSSRSNITRPTSSDSKRPLPSAPATSSSSKRVTGPPPSRPPPTLPSTAGASSTRSSPPRATANNNSNNGRGTMALSTGRRAANSTPTHGNGSNAGFTPARPTQSAAAAAAASRGKSDDEHDKSDSGDDDHDHDHDNNNNNNNNDDETADDTETEEERRRAASDRIAEEEDRQTEKRVARRLKGSDESDSDSSDDDIEQGETSPTSVTSSPVHITNPIAAATSTSSSAAAAVASSGTTTRGRRTSSGERAAIMDGVQQHKQHQQRRDERRRTLENKARDSAYESGVMVLGDGTHAAVTSTRLSQTSSPPPSSSSSSSSSSTTRSVYTASSTSSGASPPLYQFDDSIGVGTAIDGFYHPQQPVHPAHGPPAHSSPSLLPIVSSPAYHSVASRSLPPVMPPRSSAPIATPSGMVSLLRILTTTLHSTRTLLINTHATHASFVRYLRGSQAWFNVSVVGGGGLFFRHQIIAASMRWLESYPLLNVLFQDATRNYALPLRVLKYAAVPGVVYLLYRRSFARQLAELKSLHARLGILLRLWHICVSLLDQAKDSESNMNDQPISRWMLELVPPSLDASFWYNSTWQLSLLKYGMDVLYCSVSQWYGIFGPRFIGLPYGALSACYYALRPSRAAFRASELMGSPDIRVVQFAWRILDNPIMRWLSFTVLPRLRIIPRLPVCRALLLTHEDQPQILRGGKHVQTLNNPEFKNIKVTLLSSQPLDNISVDTKFGRAPSPRQSPRSVANGTKHDAQPIVLYFHGGGWVSDFSASELHFLSKWAVTTGAIILHIHYSLAPENAYPTALNECFAVYQWVVDGRLGIRPSRIILAGDSAGGNLAVSTCLKAIMEQKRTPDGMVLGYPILNLRQTPTPSRALFMMDAISPMNLLYQCRSVYLPVVPSLSTSSLSSEAMSASSSTLSLPLSSITTPSASSSTSSTSSAIAASNATTMGQADDPMVSPILASDLLLSKFPPTCIMVGGFDPFLDDSVDLAHRLHANQVPCRLKVYPNLPHSFWNFSPLLPDSRASLALAAEWIKSMF